MRSRKDNQSQFGEILDRLSPGLWLHADNVTIRGLFMPERSVGINGLTIQAAEEFAAKHECTFRYESGYGVFGRAYFKSD